jgi:hypothetical protein
MSFNEFNVVPTTSSPAIWPPELAFGADVKFYTFSMKGVEVPASVPVSISPGTKGPLTVNMIRVRVGGQWRPVKDWLLEIADDEVLEKRGVGLATQQWWARNGKKFRETLPVELRLIVWEYVVGGEGWTLGEAQRMAWGRLIL